jgi:hypothetical protein
VETWPVVRGHDYELRLAHSQRPEEPDPEVAWYHRDRDQGVYDLMS